MTIPSTNPIVAAVEPYDPKYLPADVMVSANENPSDVPEAVREAIARRVAKLPFDRYPDPLANELRDLLAGVYGLRRDQVIVGNGGDELLFNTALAFGGAGRAYVHVPPTFSTYATSAQLTATPIEEVPLRADFSIDEEALLGRVSQPDVAFTILCSPNNPTGRVVPHGFVERLLDATDALVMIDEAYAEFSGESVVDLLAEHENLAILRTLSKAYALAGVRVGYVLANEGVIEQYKRVRQPYSVDAVSQAIACEVVGSRDAFAAGTVRIVGERERLFAELSGIDGLVAYPSRANFLLVRIAGEGDAAAAEAAGRVWQAMFDRGVLARDFSHAAGLSGCLRISVGTPAENDRMLEALRAALADVRAQREG